MTHCDVGAPPMKRRSLCAGDELLEPRVLPQRVEIGIDLQPAGREDVGDFEELLELVKRLLRFARPRRTTPDERSDSGGTRRN
jgi:hypothetical protein